MWQRIVVGLCACIVAGWMTFDGGQALFSSGHLITPKSGDYAGQLGPWRHIVQAVGIDPAGRTMQLIFFGYGVAWLAIIAGFALKQEWSWTAMMAAAVGSLWFLPFGTILGIVQIALLLIVRRGV
jgi:hypothetical protein